MLLGLFLLGFSTVFLFPADARLVALPAVGITGLALTFLIRLNRGLPGMALNEMATYFVTTVSLYGIFPIIGHLARGMDSPISNDLRLFLYRARPDDMAIHGFRYLVYLSSFCAAYMVIRRKMRRPEVRGPVAIADRNLLGIALVLLIAMQCVLIYYSSLYELGGGTYWEQNERAALVGERMPLLLRQIPAHLVQAVLAAKILLLVILFARYRTWRAAIWIWMAVEVGLSASGLGARAPLAFLLLACVFLYHRFVRPLRAGTAILAGFISLAGFLLFGFVRSLGSYPLSANEFFAASNEFETVFTTGFDLYQRRVTGTLPSIPVQLYFADLIALVPSQLLPFTKWSGAEWYLELLRLRGTGIGLTFGVMGETAIGGGWFELVARGVVLAFLFARLHRWYLARCGRIWPTVLYVWLSVLSFQSFRASTFALLGSFFLDFAPFYFVVFVASGAKESLWTRKAKPGLAKLSEAKGARL